MLMLCEHFTTKPNTKKKRAGIRFWYEPKTLPRYANGFLDSDLHQILIFMWKFSYYFNSNIHMRQWYQLRLAIGISYCSSVKGKGTISWGKRKWAGMWPCSTTELCFGIPSAEFQVSHSSKGRDLKYLEVKVHSQRKQPEHDWLLL